MRTGFFEFKAIVVMLMLGMSFSTLSSLAWTSDYVNPAGDEFPLLAYHSFARKNMMTAENYEIYKECGFNVSCSYVTNAREAVEMLALNEQVGLKSIFRDMTASTLAAYRQLAIDCKQYPSCAAIMLQDEPHVSAFDTLAAEKRLILANSNPGTMVYVNVVAGNNYAKALGARTYSAFMDEYLNTVNPQFFSYDQYGITEQNGVLQLASNYFENLEMIWKRMAKAGIPLWTFVLSSAHWDYPVPDYGQLSFQAFAGLAYGSQCIQYYGYASPVTESLNFHDVPFSPEGKRNPVWYLIQKLNNKIQSLAPILLDMQVEKVWHTGRTIPEGTTRFGTGGKPQGVSNVTSNGTGVLVNQFSNGNSKYMMILNRDFRHNQQVNVSYTNPIRLVQESAVDIVSKSIGTSSATLTLAPGCAVIFAL